MFIMLKIGLKAQKVRSMAYNIHFSEGRSPVLINIHHMENTNGENNVKIIGRL